MDRRMLTTAALVCAVWYPKAMHSLYHTIEIHDRPSFEALFRQSYRYPRVRQRLATTPQLIASDGIKFSAGNGRKDGRFLHAVPLVFGHAMTTLEVLMMDGLHRFMNPAFAALPQFKSVKSLGLSNCMLNNTSQLRRIIGAFPKLQTLILRGNILARQASANRADPTQFSKRVKI
ncbi:uncharacterized protein B0H18DRAFT_989310 [Fomitopsis serialis]|uniref:uncharacterized protein n=1 Tax=Fomitopsis serialis TaxID=139415 RepID=UPI00200835D2|nr:uncharacterized protein B0H18DRAFT_989310 [Neoantrodia serialis]KAH9931436.1 hypothetical protein B0H18DRAFT_989310 [Neoantrodia serialis]